MKHLTIATLCAGLTMTAGSLLAQGEFGPYWAPPVVKGGPMPRTPDGHPNMNGYWASRLNRAIFDIEDEPPARPGGQGSKGAIVDPPGGKQQTIVALRAALQDRHVKAVFAISTVGDGLIEAAVLGLGHPVGAKGDLVERLRGGGRARERETQTECRSSKGVRC